MSNVRAAMGISKFCYIVSSREQYVERLRELHSEDLSISEKTQLDASIRSYLHTLTDIQRDNLSRYIPEPGSNADDLTWNVYDDHCQRMSRIDHAKYRKARRAGLSRIDSRNPNKVHVFALAADLLSNRQIAAHKTRVKEQGRVVQCQFCAQWFHSVETERIKPFGITTYQRFCRKCAVQIKLAQSIARSNRKGARKGF